MPDSFRGNCPAEPPGGRVEAAGGPRPGGGARAGISRRSASRQVPRPERKKDCRSFPLPRSRQASPDERAKDYSGPPGQLLTTHIAENTLPGSQPRETAADVTTSRNRSRLRCYLAAAPARLRSPFVTVHSYKARSAVSLKTASTVPRQSFSGCGNASARARRAMSQVFPKVGGVRGWHLPTRPDHGAPASHLIAIGRTAWRPTAGGAAGSVPTAPPV